ncbi:hypothetical protein C9422_20955 [Pseudomonas sp. B1(2018)]|nr:hypothetical protein C9422_20955 [Pseudomonas sp. B1(2018)]
MGECFPVGAAEGCDLLILIFDNVERAEDQDQKIATFGSSYRPSVSSPAALDLDPPAPSAGLVPVFIRGMARSAVRRSRTHCMQVEAKPTGGQCPRMNAGAKEPRASARGGETASRDYRRNGNAPIKQTPS